MLVGGGLMEAIKWFVVGDVGECCRRLRALR